jgi:predicted GNAT family N-acyltransferase
MTALDLSLIRKNAGAAASQGRTPAFSIDRMNAMQMARRTVIFTVDAAGIAALIDAAREDIPGLTANEMFQAVANHNPDTFWAIARRDRHNVAAPRGEGFLALLMLNDEGVRRLVDGRLNTKLPELCYIARQHERPAGIYVWGIHAKGVLAAAIPLVLDKISSPLYRGVNLYSRPITKGGLRVLEPLGFSPGAHYDGVFTSALQMFDRSADLPPVKATKPDPVTVEVVRSMDEMARVIAIRGAIYMAEQRCPFEEEFDGNDFSATHLICHKNGEPVGCMRIRYFAGFAKLERLAVRQEGRGGGLAGRILDAAIELCRKKGYSVLYAHSQKRFLKVWQSRGFKLMGGRELVFSDFDYVEVKLETEKHPQSISLDDDPYVIIRPEGRWDVPGILERSARRGVCSTADAR